MSPKYGQPIKEEPRVARVMVNFTIDEKERLDRYCETKKLRLSELCRKEVLKLLRGNKSTSYGEELRKVRKKAERLGLKVSKGYRKTRIDNRNMLDTDGNKITGYMITDSTNAFIDGATSEELYTMDFEELKGYFEQFD